MKCRRLYKFYFLYLTGIISIVLNLPVKEGKTDKASINRLQLTTFKLQSLLNITQAINENLTREELLEIYERLLTKDLNIGKILIFKWMITGNAFCVRVMLANPMPVLMLKQTLFPFRKYHSLPRRPIKR